MSLADHIGALTREVRRRATRWILAHRIRARHPSLHCDPTAIWDYGYDDIDAIRIGERVSVLAYANIIVRRRSPRTKIEGGLTLGDGSNVSNGVIIHAAGGIVRIGDDSAVASNSVIVAANHVLDPHGTHLHGAWDEGRVGVELDDNVWVGALCVLLPGTRIGSGAVIAAGSVVNGAVPPRELWGGCPARRLKTL